MLSNRVVVSQVSSDTFVKFYHTVYGRLMCFIDYKICLNKMIFQGKLAYLGKCVDQGIGRK